MKAAVVTSFESPPHYADFEPPIAKAGEVVVTVKAAALSQLVKSQASGKHYSAGAHLPFVPGADGVGRLESGRRVYFAFPRAPWGSMAERSVVNEKYCAEIPDGIDDITAAAIANPGMSSWAALTERAGFETGQSVLVNGATGASGRLAIRIAKHLGARRVIATGRNPSCVGTLRSLGADSVIALDQDEKSLVAAFRSEIEQGGIDVVLDYLWAESAERLLQAFTGQGSDSGAARVRYVQIGSMAGNTVTLPASVLRSSGLELLGSGLGSMSKERLVQAVRCVLGAISPAGLAIDACAAPLAEVESAWNRQVSSRTVFTV